MLAEALAIKQAGHDLHTFKPSTLLQPACAPIPRVLICPPCERGLEQIALVGEQWMQWKEEGSENHP